MKQTFIVAIDGPAGSGKSTVAKRVAQALGFVYVDTGAIYRSVALAASRRGVDLDDGPGLAALANQLNLRFVQDPKGQKVLIDGDDCSQAIRSPEASMAASRVATQAALRHALLDLQRHLATGKSPQQAPAGAVLEGRDIGSVVFPDAQLKIFLVASIEERARRRHQELLQRQGEAPEFDVVVADIRKRDINDSSRSSAPLIQAEGAVPIDTTALSIEQVVQAIIDLVSQRQKLL